MYSKFSRISRKGVPLAIGRLGLMGMSHIGYDPPCAAGTTASFSRTPDQAVSDVKGSQDILNERSREYHITACFWNVISYHKSMAWDGLSNYPSRENKYFTKCINTKGFLFYSVSELSMSTHFFTRNANMRDPCYCCRRWNCHPSELKVVTRLSRLWWPERSTMQFGTTQDRSVKHYSIVLCSHQICANGQMAQDAVAWQSPAQVDIVHTWYHANWCRIVSICILQNSWIVMLHRALCAIALL